MKKLKNFFSSNGFKKFILFGLLFFIMIYFAYKLMEVSRNVVSLSYAGFLNMIEKYQVKTVYVDGQEVRGRLQDNTFFQTVAPENGLDWSLLRSYGVDFSIANMSDYNYNWYIFYAIVIFSLIAFAWYMMRQQRGGMGGGGYNIFSMGKSRARMFMPSTIKETFASVAGAAEAKEELADVVDFLKNPQKYKRLGARMTKGVLLIGEPGNGKTLLARAVAGEANCPFFTVSGSDFIEVFVGVGAARVRDLFEQARKNAPCIIFIDEIDAVGRHRGSGLGGGNDEREQTLNQLLTEMDGFQTSVSSVIVIAATNRVDVLDKALLRPGRFDKQVQVPFPDLASRKEILTVHASQIIMQEGVDLEKIARGTPGFSGADLANLMNEGALIASKLNQDSVTVHHLEEARDKVLLGKELKSVMLTDEDKKITAYHEAGHGLASLLQPEYADPLHKITIIPRTKGALGVTHSMPEREKYMSSLEEMEASIIVALAGRAAEELIFNRLMTGAYSDFVKATHIVKRMVCLYGMGPAELGTIVYNPDDRDYSEKTNEKIDEAVRAIVLRCYEKTKQLLVANRDKLDMLAAALLEKETLYAAEIYQLLQITPRTDHRFMP